jgi:hypothetical protein
MLEHGGQDGASAEITGGRVAAPIARSVLESLLAAPPTPSRCDVGQP